MRFTFDYPIDFYSENLEIGVTIRTEITYAEEDPDPSVGFKGSNSIDGFCIPGATHEENEIILKSLTEKTIQKLINIAHEQIHIVEFSRNES